MNILLIQPEKLPWLKQSRITIPLSLLYLSAAVKAHGHTPHILDFSVLNVPSEADDRIRFLEETCNKKIDSVNASLIGINCFTTMHFPYVDELARIIKAYHSQVKICLGGAHPTYFAEEILSNCDYVDYVVTGEGEEALIGLANFIETEETQSQDQNGISSIPALIYRTKDGQIAKNIRKSYMKDISVLNMPAWDLISLSDYYANYDKYYNPKGLKFNLTVPILTSRSCPFSCTFCSAHLIMGKKYRRKTAAQVADEIEYLHVDRGQNYFSFFDDAINIDKKHIIGICNEINKRHLKIQFSVNQGLYVATVVKEVIDALADAGMVATSVPIEHGDEVLRQNIMKKKLTDEKIHEVVGYLKARDIFTVGLFIMGYPEETEKTLQKTESFIKDLSLDINGVSTLLPYPNTEVYKQAKRDGLLLVDVDDVWKGFDNFDAQNKDKFFLKPYNLSLDTLQDYRILFDSVYYYYSDRAKALNQVPV